MKTAVVILNWNTEELLRKFLPALIHSVRLVDGAEVVVADNASTDGSVEIMQTLFPDVPLLRFETNLGFTGGYNEAFKRLVTDPSNDKSKAEIPEYFLLINSDIEVNDGWLEPLVEWMDIHPDCGACAPKLHSWQQKNMFEYAGAAGGYIDRFGYPFCRGRVMSALEEDNGQYDSPKEVFWATGACLMVRTSVYSDLKGLDNRFFAHMEEIDLCWRMKLKGWSVNIVPQSCVWHVGGGTLPASSPMKLFLNYRNNLLMLSNNLAKTKAADLLRESMENNCHKDRLRGRDALVEISYSALRQAETVIFQRMVLDGMSALVYLISLRWHSFMAVIKAHRDFRKLRKRLDAVDIADYLEITVNSMTSSNKKAEPHQEGKLPIEGESSHEARTNYAGVTKAESSKSPRTGGIYPKWIVLQFLIKKAKIFPMIREWETENRL